MKAVAVSLLCLALLLLIDAGKVQRQTGGEIVALRLTGGRDDNTGVVEALVAGGWGLVCDDYFDDNAAQVVCRSLGLPIDDARMMPNNNFRRSRLDILIDDVICTGNESSLNDCQHRPIGMHNCGPREAVAVTCGSGLSMNDTEIEAIRLVIGLGGDRYMDAGRVEVFMNGTWGTICSMSINTCAIRVMCRMLGYRSDASGAYLRNADKGDGPIHLSRVHCLGHETSLNQCSYVSEHNCDHTSDVGLLCYRLPENVPTGAYPLN